MFNISWVATDALTPNRRNARTHTRKQIGQIAESIRAFGFVVPILVDEKDIIIAGHGRHSAAQLLKPALQTEHREVVENAVRIIDKAGFLE